MKRATAQESTPPEYSYCNECGWVGETDQLIGGDACPSCDSNDISKNVNVIQKP